MGKGIHRLCVLACCAGLAACSSPKKKDVSEGPKLYERIQQQQKSMTMYSSDASAKKLGDKGGTGWFQRKKFQTTDYTTPKAFAGLKDYGGAKDYKTKDYSQAGKTSRFATHESKFATKENRMGKESFATKDNHYSSKMASQNAKSFQGGDHTFKTGEFQPAKKSLKENKHIMIESGGANEERNANAYSESQVKHLLGR